MISINVVKLVTPGGTRLGLQATDEHGMQLVLPMEAKDAITIGQHLVEQGRYLEAGIVAPPSPNWRPGGDS